jgi:hypothetical protein
VNFAGRNSGCPQLPALGADEGRARDHRPDPDVDR